MTNLTEVTSAILHGELGKEFDIRGKIVSPTSERLFNFTLLTPDGGTCVLDKTGIKKCLSLRLGDIVRVTGSIVYGRNGVVVVAGGRTIDVLGHGEPPKAIDVSIADLKTGRFDFCPIRTHGIVREVFRDEIDPQWLYFAINDGGQQLYAVFHDFDLTHDRLKGLSDATVRLAGICNPLHSGQRKMLGRTISVFQDTDIEVLTPAPADPFSVPPIDNTHLTMPESLAAQRRFRLAGKVIAVRQNGSVLVRDDENEPHLIRLANGPAPAYGDRIEAAGIPETDLYRINLSDAVWRKTSGAVGEDNPPIATAAAAMLTDGRGNRKIDPTLHGKAVTVTGTVIDLPNPGGQHGSIILKCGDFTIPVDIGTNRALLADLSAGCLVSATGTCIVESENWRSYSTFPHATGIALVARTPADIRVLRRPPWWTPRRLMTVVALLLLALVVIFVWNRVLQHVISRKSRQLLKEQVAQIKATLRVDERTHLAVELHDTLSQNLSGVACQIAATKGTLPDGADETARHLATAERMLLSCRTELRRCLWDLRGDALEERDFAEAIRKTLAPVAIGANLLIRFNVPRARLSDTTAHAVLCIVRELVANAIRHGRAKTVRVAGEYHDGTLSFSVRDDGCGFDPATCAGPAEGHFGLEGVRERIKRLDGTFAIDAAPGAGARAEVVLHAPQTINAEE